MKITKKLLVRTLFVLLINCIFSINSFAQKGADISWLTEMEASGYKFYNACGQEQDVFQILKGYGINSIRLRVWVNPAGGWCGQSDVVAKAKRAKVAGMSVFLVFHFSDSWADPGQQTKPAAWKNYTVTQMCSAIDAHVKSVLAAVKATGANVLYSGVGNETNDGMLWPEGRPSTNGFNNYAAFINAGVNAVRKYKGGKAVVTLSDPWNKELYKWNLEGLYKAGGRWDVIGMDIYPAFYTGTVDEMITAIKANPYYSGAILPEIGYDHYKPEEAKVFVQKMVALGKPVYYWEPQCYNWQGYGRGAWNPDTKRPTIALQGFGGSGCTSSSVSLNGTYRIQNRGTGLFIDGYGRTTNGSNVAQYANTTHVNAQWILESAGSYYKLKNVGTGLYLDGMGRTTNGSACGQYSSSSSYNQQWGVVSIDGYYQFKNRGTGLFLDGYGRTTNGSDVAQYANTTHVNAQWSLVSVSGGGASLVKSNSETTTLNSSTSLELYQNYPNPANGNTVIAFNLAQKSNVVIQVYNLAGSLVQTSGNQLFNAGYSEVQLNVSNLQAGIYIYMISTNHGIEKRRMVIQ